MKTIYALTGLPASEKWPDPKAYRLYRFEALE
jgi:hypothetical protein